MDYKSSTIPFLNILAVKVQLLTCPKPKPKFQSKSPKYPVYRVSNTLTSVMISCNNVSHAVLSELCSYAHLQKKPKNELSWPFLVLADNNRKKKY